MATVPPVELVQPSPPASTRGAQPTLPLTLKGFVLDSLRCAIPARKDVLASLRLFAFILLGGIALFPLMSRLPVLGWDWFFFYNANHPVDNIYTPSAFLPFTKYFIMMLTWMNWRDSLALLGGITYMAIALGTWKFGGRYGSILLALLTPLPLFVLWVGHPEGLALTGMLTGFIPMALIKPQITFWSFLRNRGLVIWMGIVMGLVFIIWPYWFRISSGIRWDHPAAFGWHALGWPLLVLGVIMILGAGSDPWRLMAAGCFITPDLMPYHLIVLLPAIGYVKGLWKLAVWVAAWLVFIGIGLGGPYRFINLLFPLVIYAALQTPGNYRAVILTHLANVRMVVRLVLKPAG